MPPAPNGHSLPLMRPAGKAPCLMMIVLRILALVLLATQADAADVKIATWNLNWLTTRSHAEADLPDDVQVRAAEDFDRLHAYATRLDADIVGLQEVDGTAAAARLFDAKHYQLAMIDEPVTQQVGIAVRRGIALTRNPDVTGLDTDPEARHPLRNGLDVTLGLPDGQRLRVLVVHLKTGCWADPLASRKRACQTLAEQAQPLEAWIAARRSEGGAFVVMGDFNRRLALADDEMLAGLDAAAPLTLVTAGRASPCWGGEDFIDHILLGGTARAWLEPASLRVLTYREANADKERLSDHCPVSVRLDLP